MDQNYIGTHKEGELIFGSSFGITSIHPLNRIKLYKYG